jgi:hypothetical protein
MTRHWSDGIPALIESGSPELRRLPPIRGIFITAANNCLPLAKISPFLPYI